MIYHLTFAILVTFLWTIYVIIKVWDDVFKTKQIVQALTWKIEVLTEKVDNLSATKRDGLL